MSNILPTATVYYGKATMKENRKGVKDVRWVTNTPNSVATKSEASSFLSKESLLEAYQEHFDTSRVESFEIKTNHSPYTNSMIGSSHWLRATLAAAYDVMLYIESKDVSKFDNIKKLNALALKQMEELIENRHLLIKH